MNRKYLFFWSLLCLCFLGCGRYKELILFSSNRLGQSDIYLMDKSGSQLTPITNYTGEDWAPVWMSENQISFLREENDEIKIIQLDLKTNLEQSLSHPAECLLDDKNFVYTQFNDQKIYTCNGVLYLLKPQMKAGINLTEDFPGKVNYADWVSKEVVIFTGNVNGNNDIFTLNTRTQKYNNLSNHPANDERGMIAPNNKYLVFSSDRFEKDNQEIVLQDLQNGHITNISKSKGTELIARWSKDSKRIYYGSNKDGNWEIYLYYLLSGHTKRLTNHQGFDGDPRVR